MATITRNMDHGIIDRKIQSSQEALAPTFEWPPSRGTWIMESSTEKFNPVKKPLHQHSKG
ncbi:unnamed protein product, partial [Ilex paraguariensis]